MPGQDDLFDPRRMRARDLQEQVRHHNRRYWDDDAPEISDEAYDRLVRELKELWPDAPVLTEMGPSKKAPPPAAGAADEVARLGTEVVHAEPMLSLDKAYEDAELARFTARIQGDLLVMPKVDGVACSIVYGADGRLARAATRGDGERGDDITANVRAGALVPVEIPGGAAEVRGEIFMKRSRFKEAYAEQFANPRNLTAGAIKQKDPKKAAAYKLSFMAYDLRGRGLATEADKLRALQAAGFDVIPFQVVTREDAAAAYVPLAAKRDSWDFEADGVVYRANVVAEQARLGITAHHPRYALAYKFQGESARARLVDVQWSVSRTGTLTPVAIIEPTPLSGVTVSRASLHHAGYIGKLGLTRGATLLVMRRGDVIPHVEGVVEQGTEPIAVPTVCPSCGSAVVADGDFIQCSTPGTCPDAMVGTLKHFTATLDVQGLGPKVLRSLLDAGLVKTPADLFALRKEDLVKLDRMGDTLADKLIGNIRDRRSMTLPVFLAALGIDELGPTVADVITAHHADLASLRAATEEQLGVIHGVGPAIAASVVKGLKDRSALIDALLAHVTLQAAAAPVRTDHPLSGKAVVFTGALTMMDRKEAQKRVLALGGRTPSSVTKEVDILVTGVEKDGAESSKLKSARKLQAAGATLQVMDEATFVALLEGKGP